MNLKKFKKSLVSIVLGSSLFFGNGGVICQQSKAWLSDEFFTTARETYKDNPGMKLLLSVSEFLSKLSRPSTLETEFLSLKEKLLAEISDLKLKEVETDCLEPVIEYLKSLELLSSRSDKLAELQKKLEIIAVVFCRSNIINQSENTESSLEIVGLVLMFSASQEAIESFSKQKKLWTCIEDLCQTNKQLTNSASPHRMIELLNFLFTEQNLEKIIEEIISLRLSN